MKQINMRSGNYKEVNFDPSRLYKTAKRTRWRSTECKFCGTEIYFDDEVLSQSGTMIPMEQGWDDVRHNCPKSPYALKMKGLRK